MEITRSRYRHQASSLLIVLWALPCSCGGTSSEAKRDLIAIEMVAIPGGTLQIDSDSSGKRVHTAAIRSFYMSKYEVTQGQWRSVMGSNPAHFTAGDNYPVIGDTIPISSF